MQPLDKTFSPSPFGRGKKGEGLVNAQTLPLFPLPKGKGKDTKSNHA